MNLVFAYVGRRSRWSQLRLRLSTLLDKKRVMQQHPQSVSKTSSRYIALEEGLKQFSMDLNKLEVIGQRAPKDRPS
jgi:hypothetical protein